MIDITTYLERIGYVGSKEPTAETLAALQYAHLLSVPFENLSIHVHEPIRLEEESLFEKIVVRKRGGFCYELNILFAALLTALGYQVRLLSAEVAGADGEFSPPFDHLMLRVDLAEPWLVDVGFGDTFRHPLLLDSRDTQPQPMGSYRLQQSGTYTMLEELSDDRWVSQYRFEPATHHREEFIPRCEFQQTSPESHFTQRRVCTLATPEGRLTLSDHRFITTHGRVRTERPIENEADFQEVLATVFHIYL